VRVDHHVYVSGTAPIMPHDAAPPPDAYGQAKRCIERIEQNLAEAGASLHDVVRTRIYLVDPADIEGVGRAHGEAFAAAPPVTTGVVVARLFDPRWLVEIEAEAVILTT
jgi:enamine deaminase RidA (YjgF/YER057c/UK114 family)